MVNALHVPLSGHDHSIGLYAGNASTPSQPSNGATVIPFTPNDAKALARALRSGLEPHVTLSHGQALDVLSRTAGLTDWNALAAMYRAPGFGAPMPILRVQDAALARQFYVDWLGFSIDFEHQFEPEMPLFIRVSRDETALGLSEHYGDGTPGSVVWIPTRALASYRGGLMKNPIGSQRPGIDPDAPGGPTMTIIDPFGNELRFCEPTD
ncbi:glyoxalase superfamily protein [Micrococcus luteus]|uniref:glyoxalase superfamily protein n=1 Tax=Micrococcus luteus TaxID=1270 RepID=UPI0020046B50|nr:glyoxalase superfamily protein [Micrococcus luteus]MCV7595408.1 glyoxalase superfamily protein [Micrococcus luteus]MCV7620452.1 glyoxalase superfamily protein [Micrococcus luteus]MCV7741329.1 glyoxalase superfamily protein [Micrococcus luteus]